MLLLLVFLPRMESKRSHHYRQWAAQRWVLWRSARAQRWSQKLHFSWQWGGCGEDPVGASGIGMRKRWATSKMISSKNRISWEMVNNFKSMSSIKSYDQSEISATIGAQIFIEHPPSLPFLGMIKIGVMKFICDLKTWVLEFQLIKVWVKQFHCNKHQITTQTISVHITTAWFTIVCFSVCFRNPSQHKVKASDKVKWGS